MGGGLWEMVVVFGGLRQCVTREQRQSWAGSREGCLSQPLIPPLFPRDPTSPSSTLGSSDWVSVAGGGGEGDWLGARGDRDPRSVCLSLCLQLTLVYRPRSGPHWLNASLSLGHITGEGCLAGSQGWCGVGGGGQRLSPPWISVYLHPAFCPASAFLC